MNTKNVLVFVLATIFFMTMGDESAKYYIPEHNVLKLYQLMKDVHEILEKNNIPYWVHAGTLIGVVRHMGLIPWDDDLDIAIDINNEQDLLQIFPEIKKLGYFIIEHRYYHQYAIHFIGDLSIGLDIMCLVKNNNGEYCYSKEWEDMHQGYFFKTEELFPLQICQFGGIQVFGPKNPIPFLNRSYKDWNLYAIMYNHHTLGSQKVLLTDNLRNPAKPMGPLQDRVSKN